MSALCKETMINAYRNISFHMEERGESDFKYYTELLKKDLEALGENTGKYSDKFQEKVMSIYSAKSRTASSFIVGPAKFKVTERANNSERKHIEHFTYWRERYFKLVNRVRKASPVDDIAKHKLEIEKLEKQKADWKAQGYGSRDYRISNTNANIRYYKKKIEALEARTKLSEIFTETIIPNGKIYFSNDRLVIEHNNKPDKETITLIKGHGFKYSPKTTTWVRQFTGNAVHSARQLVDKLNKEKSNEQSKYYQP